MPCWQVKVSTGGFLERVLASGAGPCNVVRYMETVKELGFDILELSTGFIALPLRDWQKLVEDAQDVGLTVRWDCACATLSARNAMLQYAHTSAMVSGTTVFIFSEALSVVGKVSNVNHAVSAADILCTASCRTRVESNTLARSNVLDESCQVAMDNEYQLATLPCWLCVLQPQPEIGIQFGAGGTSSAASLAAEGTRDVKQLIKTCQAFLQQVGERTLAP